MTQEGIDLVKGFESCRLQAFWDELGKAWTIAWGRTSGVKSGDICTQAQADSWLMADLAAAEGIVLQCLGDVPVSDNQLSALTSFVYNIGPGQAGVKDGFRCLENGNMSTMLKCLLDRDYAGAATQFPFWDHCGGVQVPGLLRRRKAEQALFNGTG